MEICSKSWLISSGVMTWLGIRSLLVEFKGFVEQSEWISPVLLNLRLL